MRKRRCGERERDGGRATKRRRQHLYLVFDDWSWGYSIRKVNLSSAAKGEATEQPLPRAFFRLEAPRKEPKFFASAFGTKIMAMQEREPWGNNFRSGNFIPIFDVRSRSVTFCRGRKLCIIMMDPIYFPIGDVLFVLDDDSLYLFRPPPLESPGSDHLVRSWLKQPMPPIRSWDVTGYAVHPNGQTLVASTTMATFTFDTVAKTWKRHGEWSLPFTGRGHFVRHLDAFVGLSKDPDHLGHLCSCDATNSDTGNAKCPAPAWKLGKENLFSDDPAEKHVNATLVYMGLRSNFCLVRCVSVEHNGNTDRQEGVVPRRSCYLYRVTTFSLSYDKNGRLTTGDSRRVLCYNVPKATSKKLLRHPVAFWL